VGWTALLEIFLQAPEPLSRKLWHLYEPQCPLMTRYLLTNALDEGFGAPAERVLQVITPQLLLRLTLELSPEQCGRVRDHAIVALEARILDFMQYKERTPWYA
jgi:hypothetical protein